MALASGTNWRLNASATANNVNGGGFNINNANMLTDLACDTGTGNTASPVVSSASYNFVAGDVGAWLYVKSGTNWTPGFYEITSVAANKATLKAAVGEASQFDTTSYRWKPNTVAGCATTGTPTGGTFGVDFSFLTAARATNTDLTCTAASTTVTSASAPFTRVMVGNIVNLTALTGTGAITGWYEIVNFTDTSNVVLDRTPTNGVNNITAGTFQVGGALSMNSTLDDDFFEAIVGGNFVYIKNGTYSIGEAINVASTSSSITSPSFIIGYNTVPGDNPTPFGTSSSAPLINFGANACTLGQSQNVEYLRTTSTGTTGLGIGANTFCRYVNAKNTSTTANRAAITNSSSTLIYSCEAVSQNGHAFSLSGTDGTVFGCYSHDSNNGITTSTTRIRVINCVAISCRNAGITSSSSVPNHFNNTCYGYSTPRGSGIVMSSSNLYYAIGNLVAGWSTGVSNATTNLPSILLDYSFLYNCTTNYSNVHPQANGSTSTDPQFTDLTELSGSTATISGTTLTQSGGDFSTVEDNVDYLHVHSGTGATAGVYLITSHTSTTVTVNNTIGTNATADKVWTIRTGSNFSIGANLKGLGFPGPFDGVTTGYMDPGAVQRQETGGSGVSRSRIQRKM